MESWARWNDTATTFWRSITKLFTLCVVWDVYLSLRHMNVMASQVSRYSTFCSVLSLTTKKTSKFCITGPMWGESIGHDGFPSQRLSNAESVSMSWRHRGYCFTQVASFPLPGQAQRPSRSVGAHRTPRHPATHSGRTGTSSNQRRTVRGRLCLARPGPSALPQRGGEIWWTPSGE